MQLLWYCPMLSELRNGIVELPSHENVLPSSLGSWCGDPFQKHIISLVTFVMLNELVHGDRRLDESISCSEAWGWYDSIWNLGGGTRKDLLRTLRSMISVESKNPCCCWYLEVYNVAPICQIMLPLIWALPDGIFGLLARIQVEDDIGIVTFSFFPRCFV